MDSQNLLDIEIRRLAKKKTEAGKVKLSKNPTAATVVAAAVLGRAMDGAPEAVKLVKSALEAETAAADNTFKLEIEVIK